MKNLIKRAITGVVFVAIMLLGLSINQYFFVSIFGIFLLLSHFEFYRLIGTSGYRPNMLASTMLGMVLFVVSYLVASKNIDSDVFFTLPFFIVLFFVIELYRDKKNTLKDTYTSLAAVVYIAVPFSMLNFIIFDHAGNFSSWITIGIFLMIWGYDTFAFIGGVLIGKHKLMKRLSPKKTWEGLVIGGAFALLLSYFLTKYVGEISIEAWMGIALIIVSFGTLGDLFESKLKRTLHVKDSGKFLPGHGGLLDRFDTLLFVAPVVLAWLYIVEKFNI